MWAVEDSDTTLYLLGTMHALPDGTDWNRGAVADAIAAADSLLLELSPAELANASAVMARLARRESALPLIERLPADLADEAQALDGHRLNIIEAGMLDDWAIALALSNAAARDAGLSGENGVEAGLARAFAASGKPVTGLESAMGQLMLFETLPDAAQRAMLVQGIAEQDRAPAKVRDLTRAWAKGDVAAIDATIRDDMARNPHAMRVLLTDRNRLWAEQLAVRMDRPGTVLVAVGAGHLAGPDNVPALLAAQGWSVRRVQ